MKALSRQVLLQLLAAELLHGNLAAMLVASTSVLLLEGGIVGGIGLPVIVMAHVLGS